MKELYILRHIYNFEGEDGSRYLFEDKFLGIYSSMEKAEEAIERYIEMEGFQLYPRKCFQIEKWKTNLDSAWREGFVKMYEANLLKESAERYDENDGGFDVSSWLSGEMPYKKETPLEFAKRMLDEKFGEGNWNLQDGLLEEYNNLLLYGEIGFEQEYAEGD